MDKQMTYEEALKHFESLQKRYTREHNGKMCEKVRLAITAITKQIPMEPVDNHHCPRCLTGIPIPPMASEAYKPFAKYPKYCDECGQAIRWGRETTNDDR